MPNRSSHNNGSHVIAWRVGDRKSEACEMMPDRPSVGVVTPLFEKPAALAEAYMVLREMSATEIARWVTAMRTRPAPR